MATPQDISDAFVDEAGWPKRIAVTRSQCSAWMDDPSLETRGTLFHFLCDRANISRVEIPFTSEELFVFITKYFHDCLEASEELADGSKWVLRGLDLTHAIAYWASGFWKQKDGSNKERVRLMSWLRSALLDFPQHRALLTTALADHLFSQKRIRKDFAAWASDPDIGPLFPELSGTRAT